MQACHLSRDTRRFRYSGRNSLWECLAPYSSPHFYINLTTKFYHRALAADGRDWPAKVLSETYQEIVVLDPVLFGKLFSESGFCFLRRLSLDVTPTVGNPMNMGIDTDAGL